MGFSIATLDRLKPPARDPRKATRCGAFLTLVGIPAALTIACYFIVRAELASPVLSESTSMYIQNNGPYMMPVTCRSPNGCLVIASYEEQPSAASKCTSMDKWRPLRYGETAMLPFCYSPGLRDGIYIIWNRYPQRVLNGTTSTDIPDELLWPSYYGTDGLRLKDDNGKIFFPFGASTVYRGLKEASLAADSKGALGGAKQCPTAIEELVQTMDREAEATSMCNAELAKIANDAAQKKGGTRLEVDPGLSKATNVGGDVQRDVQGSLSLLGGRRRRLQSTTHGLTHMTHFMGGIKLPTAAPTAGRTGTVSSNLSRLSSGLRINTSNDGGNNDGNGNPKSGSAPGEPQNPKRGMFDRLGNTGWFSSANIKNNYDGVTGRRPDGDGQGLRDLPHEEIVRICHAINTRTTAIPHGTSLVTMDFQEFSKFSCGGGDHGLFPVRTDDGSAAPDGGAAERTDSVVSFTPTNVDPGPFEKSARTQKGEKPWLTRMPKSDGVGMLLLEREIIRVAPSSLASGGNVAAGRRFWQSKANLAYFRDNIVHSHLKLMPIATHTLFERKEVLALVLAALGGFFALILASARLIALGWLQCSRASPKRKKGGRKGATSTPTAAGIGGAASHVSSRAVGRHLNKQHQASAVELLAVDSGSSRSVPVVMNHENPMVLRRAVTTATAV